MSGKTRAFVIGESFTSDAPLEAPLAPIESTKVPLSAIDTLPDSDVFRFSAADGASALVDDSPETYEAPARGASAWQGDGSGWSGGGDGSGWSGGGDGSGWSGGGDGSGWSGGGDGSGWSGGGDDGGNDGGGDDSDEDDDSPSLPWIFPTEVVIEHDGIERTFSIITPKDFDPADTSTTYSAVMSFHGGGDVGTDAAAMAGLTDFSGFEDPPEFIEIYPQATEDGWAWDPEVTTVDDVAFIEALVGELVSNWAVDGDRLFATGISAGGNMIQRLAIESPDLFAGYGVVASNLPGSYTELGTPDGDLPMIFFDGTEDPNFVGKTDYWGNELMLSAEATAEFWADWNDTELGGYEYLPDIADDGMLAKVRTSADGTIAHYVVEGGDHSWPGSLSGSAQDIDASELMVEFFGEYGL